MSNSIDLLYKCVTLFPSASYGFKGFFDEDGKK